MKIFSAEVAVTRDDLHKHLKYPFRLFRDAEKLTVRYSYSPKRYEGDDSYALARAAFSASYPEGAEPSCADIEAELPLNNHLTLSLEREGKLVGTAHRHAPEAEYYVTAASASPGFTPTAVEKGEWAVVLSAHAVLDEKLTATIEAEAE